MYIYTFKVKKGQKMVSKETILEFLNSLHEHKMAKDIFVPVLKKMGLKGVKFTGGQDEVGIDIEYYELTQPENHRSYVGIQFKKGNLVYSGGGSKNSVREVKNQAEEAFDKEIYDTDNHATLFISRFIVATTGEINEKARSYIGKARQKGKDRRIDYWTGDRLAENIQTNWMNEFIEYFKIDEEEEVVEDIIVDIEYIKENFTEFVQKCNKVKATLNFDELSIVRTIFNFTVSNDNSCIPLADLLIELENTEEYFSDEFRHLIELDYIEVDDYCFSLSGHANKFEELYSSIDSEIRYADEDSIKTIELFNEIIAW